MACNDSMRCAISRCVRCMPCSNASNVIRACDLTSSRAKDKSNERPDDRRRLRDGAAADQGRLDDVLGRTTSTGRPRRCGAPARFRVPPPPAPAAHPLARFGTTARGFVTRRLRTLRRRGFVSPGFVSRGFVVPRLRGDRQNPARRNASCLWFVELRVGFASSRLRVPPPMETGRIQSE